MHFFSNDSLEIGTGISELGDLRLTPFIQPLKLNTSTLNYDEFKHQLINQSRDYEKLKDFHFGFDLNKSIPISVKNYFNFGFDQGLKSNEQLVHAYRLILKNQISIVNSPQLNDDAKEILLESKNKFHEKYGDYYITSVTKGGAMSISAKLTSDFLSKQNNISGSTNIKGDIVPINGELTNDFDWKNDTSSTNSLSACVTATIGLTTQFQSTDYNVMLKEIEKLNDYIQEGSNIYYIVNKYELCNDYVQIQNRKSKFKQMIEKFEELHLEVQRNNLVFLDNLTNLKKQAKDKNELDLKNDEIKVEITLSQLQEQSDKLNLNKRLDECVKLIKTKNTKLAVERIGIYGTSDFIYQTIYSVYQNNDSCFYNVFNFIKALSSLTQQLEGYLSFLDALKATNAFFTSKTVELAYQVKLTFENEKLNGIQKLLYDSLKILFPRCVQILIWEPYFYIKNKKYDKSLYSTHDYFEYFNKDFKRVFIASNNYTTDFQWRIESNDDGKTFSLINKNTHEYSFLEAISCVKKSFKLNQEKIVMSCVRQTAEWIFEPIDNETLRISQNEFYLFGHNHVGIIRSDIFACSQSGTENWDELINENGSFILEKDDQKVTNEVYIKRVTDL